MSKSAIARSLVVLVPWLGLATAGLAQDLEPRRWTHLPVGTDIVAVGYGYTLGDLDFDPVLRIDDADVDLHTLLLSYIHYFGLFDRTARVDVRLPAQSGRWEGQLNGAPESVSRQGLADPIVRLSVALAGAPALDAKELGEHQAARSTNTTVGAALGVRLPLGEYREDKLINLGQNRFAFMPQLGVVHTRGPWSYELTGSLFLFTDNDEFFGDHEREQDPQYSVQAHVVRVVGRGHWLSAGLEYAWAGESEIDGVPKDDEHDDLSYGLSYGFPLAPGQSLKLAYVHGAALAKTGADTDNFVVGWSLRL